LQGGWINLAWHDGKIYFPIQGPSVLVILGQHDLPQLQIAPLKGSLRAVGLIGLFLNSAASRA
jgi:hypothetical protein